MAFQHQPQLVDPKDIGHFGAKPRQEIREIRGLQHGQNRAMHLLGARKVFVGGGQNGAVRRLQPVQRGFQQVHRRAAHVDHIFAHRTVVGRNQRPHHVAIFKDHLWLRDDGIAQLVQYRSSIRHEASWK